MNILAIESSCDETAVALVSGDAHQSVRVVSERIASQIDVHARFGGVVPEIASREHLAVLPAMVQDVMRDAQMAWQDLHAIAVTSGPGLMGALLVGTSYARGLSRTTGLPVIPVHHMEGHLLAPGLSSALPAFPFMTLLVSGGHTMLVRVNAIGDYHLIGQTIDDAAGECFDKSARLLGLSYPGGPSIAKAAEEGDATRFALPRPMLHKPGYDFSFSGLKTAVMYTMKKQEHWSEQDKADLAASVQAAIADVLVKKTVKACVDEGVTSLIVAGGVAANQCLRMQLHKAADCAGLQVHVPDAKYCTDNAAMIAYAALYHMTDTTPDAWDVNPRWSLFASRG